MAETQSVRQDGSRRRRLAARFSLRSFFVVVTLLAVWMGIQTTHARRTRAALGRIAVLGGSVHFAHQYDASGAFNKNAAPAGPQWLRDLVGGEYFDRVVYIQVQSPQLTDEDLITIAALGDVKIFWLEGTSVSDQGMQHVAKMKKLERLFLAGTAIGDEGLRHLRSLRRLTGINLDNTRITDSGLADLAYHRGLISLNVSGTQITGAGLAHVHDLPKLEYMDLKRTRITNDGLKILGERTTPWWLDVRLTAVTDDGIADLVQVPALRNSKSTRGRPGSRRLRNCGVHGRTAWCWLISPRGVSSEWGGGART